MILIVSNNNKTSSVAVNSLHSVLLSAKMLALIKSRRVFFETRSLKSVLLLQAGFKTFSCTVPERRCEFSHSSRGNPYFIKGKVALKCPTRAELNPVSVTWSKLLRVLLFLPGWVQFTHLGEERQCGAKLLTYPRTIDPPITRPHLHISSLATTGRSH